MQAIEIVKRALDGMTILADGCIIVIRQGQQTATGQRETTVHITAESYDGEWGLPDFESPEGGVAKTLNVVVLRYPESMQHTEE